MAKDIIHDAVKQALIKDGWTITDDPFRVQYEEFELFADLGAKRQTETNQIEYRNRRRGEIIRWPVFCH